MAASREAATELAPEPGEFFSSFFFLMLSISRGNRARFRFKAMKNKQRPRAPESDAFFSSFFFLMISRGKGGAVSIQCNEKQKRNRAEIENLAKINKDPAASFSR